MRKYNLINIFKTSGTRTSQSVQPVRTKKSALPNFWSVCHRPGVYLLSFLFITFLSSCNDYLEETPDNRVELNNLVKASQLLTNAYADGSYNFTEWMGDKVSYTVGTFKQPEYNEAYQWEEVIAFTQDTPTNFWNDTYEAIAHANEVLAVIDELPGEESRRRAVKAEALLARAYGHFMLVNLFAEHYNAATAAQYLGIPYIEEPERVFIKKYDRNSVAEVYEKVERDMVEGIELANDAFFANSGKYHFNKNAALALASRYYLFKGDYDNCIKYSSQMLGSKPETFVRDMQALKQQKVTDEDYIRLINSPNEEANLLLIRQVTNFHLSVGYWPSSNLFNRIFQNNPFNDEDIRGDLAFVRGENGVTAARFEFLFERSSLTSDVGFNYTIMLAFRGEEVLLNRAESYIMKNQINEAIADLQVLARMRYDTDVNLSLQTLLNYYGTSNAQEACLNYLQDERIKEFIHEGLRWFDIKRYGLEVQHIAEDGSVITLAEDDPRKVLQIPQSAIDIGGLVPNPR